MRVFPPRCKGLGSTDYRKDLWQQINKAQWSHSWEERIKPSTRLPVLHSLQRRLVEYMILEKRMHITLYIHTIIHDIHTYMYICLYMHYYNIEFGSVSKKTQVSNPLTRSNPHSGSAISQPGYEGGSTRTAAWQWGESVGNPSETYESNWSEFPQGLGWK